MQATRTTAQRKLHLSTVYTRNQGTDSYSDVAVFAKSVTPSRYVTDSSDGSEITGMTGDLLRSTQASFVGNQTQPPGW